MAIFLQRGCTNAPETCSQFAIAVKAITFTWLKRVTQWVAVAVFCLATGCTQVNSSVHLLELPDRPTGNEVRALSGDISEVAPPAVFLDLTNLASDLRPQVEITYPQPNQTLNETEFAAKIGLRGLSIYKEEKTQLGPHLKAILDNQPARDIYDLDEPVAFSELLPGSHTLRVFAVLPWGESFKNTAAYAQTTFHILAPTTENTPDSSLPLLTYNEPQGSFGAQPVLLDFYLNNAPLHLIAAENIAAENIAAENIAAENIATENIATENPREDLRDWQIRCTVNGQTFLFDQWRPVYLKGLKPGQNWVQLSLVDKQGKPIDNAFNSTVRLVNYDPDIKDTLSKLVRGELPVEQIGQTVIPDYEPPVEPQIVPTPAEDENAVEIPEPLILEPLEEAFEPGKNRELVPDRLLLEEDKSSPLLDNLKETESLEETKDLEETKSLEETEGLEETERESLKIDNSEEEILEKEILEKEILEKEILEKEILEKEISNKEILNEEIPEELAAPTAEQDIDFLDRLEDANVDQDEAFEASEEAILETESPVIAPFEPELPEFGLPEFGLPESGLPESEPPAKTGFLEQLRTKWSAFQKGQMESQSETSQPAKAPVGPSTQVYTDMDELREDTESSNDLNEPADTMESAESQTMDIPAPIEPELP